MLVPASPYKPLDPWPTGSAASRTLRRWWPSVMRAAMVGVIAATVGLDLAATVNLIPRATAFWLGLDALGLGVVLGVVTVLLTRFKLVDEDKSPSSLTEDVPVIRPPPPINEPATADDATPAKPRAVGGEIPAAVSGAGRKANWRLEGDFDWRPPNDDAP